MIMLNVKQTRPSWCFLQDIRGVGFPVASQLKQVFHFHDDVKAGDIEHDDGEVGDGEHGDGHGDDKSSLVINLEHHLMCSEDVENQT